MFPYLAALKALPWRLIGYCAAALAAVLLFHRVSVWHDGYKRTEAAEEALDASRAQVAALQRERALIEQARASAALKAEKDALAAMEVESELKAKLAQSDAYGRDMARRLRNAFSGRGAVSAPAAAPGEPVSAPGEPAGDGAIEAATADAFGACKRDADRLGAWQEWWARVGQ